MSPQRHAVASTPTPHAHLERLILNAVCAATAYHGLSPHERRSFQRLHAHASDQPAAGVFFRPFAAIAEQLEITPQVLRRIAYRPQLLRGSDDGDLTPFVHQADGRPPATLLRPPASGPCWFVPLAVIEAAERRRDLGHQLRSRLRLVSSNPKASTYDARA